MKIEIILNGRTKVLEAGTNIEALITELGLQSKWVIAELNGKPLFRGEYAQTSLNAGDHLELVRAVSGG